MAEFSLSEQTNLFKINYYKKSDNMYNSENVMQGRMKKRYDFTGKQRFVATPLSFSGGVGSGTLPTSNSGRYKGAIITAKSVYATCQIEREAIKASSNNAGAFVQATKETVKKTVESYMRNSSRILFGSGDGSLGTVDAGVVDNGGGEYELIITTGTWKEPNFEEKDYVNIGAGNTDLFEIIAVAVATRTVTVQRTTGAGVPAAADVIFMQGSENNDPIGLKAIADASILGPQAVGVNTLYEIDVERKWSMTVSDAAGTGITVDKMNGVMLDIERKFGQVPKMIMTGYAQFRNILALLEDQKVYNLPNRNIKGNLSFQGVEFMSTRGPVGIFVDRFCEDDRVYFLNDDFMECHHRPDFGWFDDDGTVFLRKDGIDSYEARYGGYYENYITPTAHGVLYDLAI